MKKIHEKTFCLILTILYKLCPTLTVLFIFTLVNAIPAAHVDCHVDSVQRTGTTRQQIYL